MVKEIKIEKKGGGFYTLRYENELEDDGSELYKAICKIPPRHFLDLYTAINPNFNVIEYEIELFGVEIVLWEKQLYFSIFPYFDAEYLRFSLFDFEIRDLGYNFASHATKVWREFMHKELGDMYSPMLTDHIKKSIEREIAENDEKSYDLVAKLAQLKQAQAELAQERLQLNQKLAELEGKCAAVPAADEETLAPTRASQN